MRIFITGATGFIGSALLPLLIESGHSVVGLTRSAESASALKALGGEALLGSVEDHEILKEGVRRSDGVIHLAFDYNITNFKNSSDDDRKAVEAMGEELLGTKKPLLVSSVIAAASAVDGGLITEESPLSPWNPRTQTEEAVRNLAADGVNTSIIRSGVVHDTRKQAFVSVAANIAKAKGRSVYIGNGSNRWCAAHVSDVAKLYQLAFERAGHGSVYHSAAEEGVPMKEIAEAVARRLGLPTVSVSPEEAEEHFGWLAMFMSMDLSASSEITRTELAWNPKGPGLVADLDNMNRA